VSRRTLLLLTVAVVVLGCGVVLVRNGLGPPPEPPGPAPSADASTAIDRRLVRLIDDLVGDLADAAPGGAPSGCFRCDAGPALALASAAAVTRDRGRRDRAVAVFDEMIRSYQRKSGAFGPDHGSSDIDTMFFAAELGIAAVVLDDDLDPHHRQTWSASVARAADFLVANGNLAWYTNGNINVGNALVMALAARLTGEPTYTVRYDQAIRFAIEPPLQRWPGLGLTVTREPTRADGSDGKGFFAEASTRGRAGYDPEYTMLQLDQLTRIFLVNNDPRVLRAMNLLANQLLDRVDTTTWLLDTSGGTRGRRERQPVPLDSAGLIALVELGGRADLRHYIGDQLTAIESHFRQKAPELGDRMKYALGMTCSSILMSLPTNARMR